MCRLVYEFFLESNMQYNFLASSAPSLLSTLPALCNSEKLIRLVPLMELVTVYGGLADASEVRY